MAGRKVVIADTDHLWGIGGDVDWVWKTVTAGSNLLFMDTYDGRVLGRRRDKEFDPVRRALGQAVALAREFDLSACVPDQHAASTGRCLSRRGHLYLIYAAEGGTFSVDLTGASHPFAATWIDPVTGVRTAGEPVAGGDVKTVTAPTTDRTLLLLQTESQPAD